MSDDLRTRLDEYVTKLFAAEDDILLWIQAETDRNQMPRISLKSYEGRLLQFLALSAGAQRIVEIGTLAGYSGVWLGRALPPGGRLYTLEVSSKHARVARANFERAGLGDRIEVIEGSALDSLRKLAAKGPFDLVFIDADKESYPTYLNWAVENLRSGGIVAAHNAFRHGGILDPQDEGDRAMAEFNRMLAEHQHLESTILAVGDGMAVGIKKG